MFNREPLKIGSTTNYLMHIPTACILIVFLAVYALPLLKHASLTELLSYILALAIADTITGCFHLLIERTGKPRIPHALGFFISGCALLSLYFVSYGNQQYITFLQAAIIGIAQAVSLLPGISRLAMTLTTAVWLGIDPFIGALFSLNLELGLISVALAKATYTSMREGLLFPSISYKQATWLLISSLVAYLLLTWVIWSLLNKTIVFFGWYLLSLAGYLYWKRTKRNTIYHS